MTRRSGGTAAGTTGPSFLDLGLAFGPGLGVRSAAFVLVAMLAAGCAVPVHEPLPIDAEAEADQLLGGSLEDPKLSLFLESQGLPAPLASDPVSARVLVLTALWRAPELALARSRGEVADAEVRVAILGPRSAFVPELEYHTEENPWTLGLSVERPFTAKGLAEARADAARADGLALRLEAAHSVWEIRNRVLSALFSFLFAEQDISFAEKEVDLRAEETDLVQHRTEAGLESGSEVVNARIRAQTSRLSMQAARSKREEALAELASALTLPVSDLRHRTFAHSQQTLDAGDVADFVALGRHALVDRSDVRAALAHYGAAEARLRVALVRSLPDISLSPGILWDQKDLIFRLSGALVPDPVRVQARIGHAEALRGEARSHFHQVQAAALAEIDIATARHGIALTELDAAVAEETAAGELLQRAEEGIRGGVSDTLDQVRLRLHLLAAERARMGAWHRLSVAVAELEAALERPLSGAELPSEQPWLPGETATKAVDEDVQ